MGEDPADAMIGSVTADVGDEAANHDHYLYGWPKETGMQLLVDTSALLALALRNDAHHPAAAGFLRGARRPASC